MSRANTMSSSYTYRIVGVRDVVTVDADVDHHGGRERQPARGLPDLVGHSVDPRDEIPHRQAADEAQVGGSQLPSASRTRVDAGSIPVTSASSRTSAIDPNGAR